MNDYSVLMSVYHKEKPSFFREAIDSMLQQTIAPGEIVLVCDGPLTAELDAVIDDICQIYPNLFHIIRLPENRGLGVALDIGLRQCKYPLVARMDTDDISLPDRIEKQLELMERSPWLSAVGGQIAEFAGNPNNIIDYRQVPQSPESVYKWAKKRNPMNHMTMMLRKEDVLEAGSYQHVSGFEDYFLWIRMLARGQKLQNIGDVCCYVRADDNFFCRRGGWDYFLNTLHLEKYMLKTRFINAGEFAANVVLRFTGTVLVPPYLRATLFQKFLRKNSINT